MAQLKPCESEEEFIAAWKAGLLVSGMGNSILSYSDYTETFGVAQLYRVYGRNRHNVFILVEDEED